MLPQTHLSWSFTCSARGKPLCLSWDRWKIIGVLQAGFFVLHLPCKLTLLLFTAAPLAGSATKLMPEGLVCTDEWNNNTGFQLNLTPQQRACPLDQISLSEVLAIPFSSGWFIPTCLLFPMRSHKLSFKGKPLSKFIAYTRFFILEEAKP